MKPFRLPFGLTPNAKKPDDSGPYYADIQARGLAAMIDILLLFTLFQQSFDALTQRLYTHVDHDLLAQARLAGDSTVIAHLLWQSHLPYYWMLNAIIQVAIIGVAVVATQCWLHTTPGKWLLGLRILRADSMQPPQRWRYILRFLAYIPACLPLMLGIFWMSFNKRRRGLHDMIAGTVVVHIHPRGWAWRHIKRGFHWLWARTKR